MSIAFIIGNGTSRESIDVSALLSQGTVYGCNALYRELIPHHLIAVDVKMMKEIVDSGYHLKNSVWSNSNAYTRSIPKVGIFKSSLGWSSGPSALNLATEHGMKTVYILGFDYKGLGQNGEYVNNIYSGTDNYKTKNAKATYFGNWARQTATVIQKNNLVKYIRVIKDSQSFTPDVFRNLPNLTHITVQDFKKIYKC